VLAGLPDDALFMTFNWRARTMTDKAASTAVARTMDVPALIAGLITVTAWGSAFVAIRARTVNGKRTA
jgi:hypothetical protein